ncbi:hypothetical protein QPK31_25005 [Massilia sp. YIM B02769]|uniref:head-tail connector protein n=1 Tax=Massilia sp. YIM B02769 TaxID=3050129 RepID=UPI0025B63E67|nr:hypothetical protein [Massilia sp. YIM B02769]MDN4061486.1 hypothetical protein [Massilia sp. YIM B02769]
MTPKVITPPAQLAVSLDSAITAARANGAGLDGEVEQAVKTATAEAEFETQRAFITQTLRLTLDRFDDSIKLPRPRLIEVVHVKFIDQAGQQQELHPQDYQVDAESEPAYIVPAPGKTWPATAARINAVEVQYVAGYGPDHTSVPDSVKGFILRRVAEQFGQLSASMAASAVHLLDGEVVY